MDSLLNTSTTTTKERQTKCSKDKGGEQGDSLMPALYALGQHAALKELTKKLLPTGKLCTFLDDVYILCKPDRLKHLYDRAEHHFFEYTGVYLNMGKSKSTTMLA